MNNGRKLAAVLLLILLGGAAVAFYAMPPAERQDEGIGRERAEAVRGATPQATATATHDPQVLLRGGLLTVRADGASLAQTLAAVHAATGIVVTMPSMPADPVHAALGPGTPRDVLDRLLAPTHYGFLLEAGPGASDSVARIILLARGDAAPVPAVRRPPLPPIAQTPEAEEAGRQQQRQFDTLFQDCKQQGCDAS